MKKPLLCPCHSQKPYASCCQPLHEGRRSENALQLMRSRYSAYALGLASYIIQTTHPSHPLFKKKLEERQADIWQFTQNTTFDGLDIIEFIDGQNEAYVTFRAKLTQNGFDASFSEKSLFYKVAKKPTLELIWVYVKAVDSQAS